MIGKIIIIQSFRVSTSKNKNIDCQDKETRAMFGLPIQSKNCTINVSLTLFVFFELKKIS